VGQLKIATVDEDTGQPRNGSCTAWIIGESEVMTAGHCLSNGQAMAIYNFSGLTAWTMAIDRNVDLGVLYVPGLHGPALALASSDPEVGQDVYTAGYPAKIFIEGAGTWSGRDDDGDGVVALTSYHGASGSPILNRDGQVVCVLEAIRHDFVGVTFCIPHDVISNFLVANHLRG
jgi:S1-C subfamily serine protease